MSEQTEFRIPDGLKKSGKHISDGLLAALGILGPPGNVLGTALLAFLTTRRIEHINDTLQAMAKRVGSVDPASFQEYLSSDEYMHLFLETLQKAQIEHQENKRRLYGSLLANMACEQETPYDEKSLFIVALAEMEPLDIRILDLLRNTSRESNEHTWPDFKRIRDTVSPLKDRSNYVLVAILQRIAKYGFLRSAGAGRGVIMTNPNPVGMWFHSNYAITDLGRKFLEFLE